MTMPLIVFITSSKNVSMRYGKPCAELGFALPASYSTVQEEKFIKCIWSLNLKSMEYLSQIPLHHWHSTEWTQNHELPSHYGMLMSSTAESFNALINKYHNGGWMECVNAIL